VVDGGGVTLACVAVSLGGGVVVVACRLWSVWSVATGELVTVVWVVVNRRAGWD
jgi:hypothetical protein